jgi:ribosomal protein S18 acetylase RimI-like enzyme
MENGQADRSNVFNRVAQLLEQGGVEHLLVRAFGKLTSPAFSIGSLIFFRRDLQEPTPQPQPIPGITLRFASLEDAPLLGGNDPVVTRNMAYRLECGDLCCMGIDRNGRLAHYRWAAARLIYVPELDRSFAPDCGEVYLYDLLTVPGFRGMGIDTQSRLMVYARLIQANIRALHCYVRADNPEGLRVARKWHRRTGRVWYVKLRGFPTSVFGVERLDQLSRCLVSRREAVI